MPTWLLRDLIQAYATDLTDLDDLGAMAGDLHVSHATLIDRLHNLGEIGYEDRVQLRTRIAKMRSSTKSF